MPTSRRIDLVLLLLGILILSFLQLADASSQRRGPLSYITHITEPRIRTPSLRAHSHSSFDLLFALHDGEQDVKLTLEPNNDLIAEGATIKYTRPDGSVERTEPLHAHEHKVYKGRAWLRDEAGWYHVGWARITVLKDGANPVFEGAFTINQDAHHVLLRSKYAKTRRPGDPEVDIEREESLVVWKDSDILPTPQEEGFDELKKRDGAEGLMCPSDKLAFNAQGAWRNADEDLEGWGVFGTSRIKRRLTKRQTWSFDEGAYGSPGATGTDYSQTIGSTDGCFRTRMVALVGIATDCTYTNEFESEEATKNNILTQLNSASSLYEQSFNISLGLAQLTISPANCPGTPPDTAKWNLPCRSETDIEQRLSLFSEWRGKQGDDGLAFWTLLTTCETGSSVGLAWLGQVCKSSSSRDSGDGSFVTGANVVARTDYDWKVIAHEVGHTMGAIHDCTADTCAGGYNPANNCCPRSTTTCSANGEFMMNPATSQTIQEFSPCSIGNICSGFKKKLVDTSCFATNKGVRPLLEAQCGNGIVEHGEECDCGDTAGCKGNSCCDGATCKFRTGAVCDDSNEDCCRSCQFAANNVICRPSNGECDPAETCTGASASCPSDTVSPDGTACGSSGNSTRGGLQCISGECTSRDQQCAVALPKYSQVSACDGDSCYIGCKDPSEPNMCTYVRQNFLNGTPCKGDGRCLNGSCTGSSTMGQIKAWINNNKPLFIGVVAGVGGLILLSILSCIWSRCCSSRSKAVRKKRALPASRNPAHWQAIPSRDEVSGNGQPMGVYPMPLPMSHNSPPRRQDSGAGYIPPPYDAWSPQRQQSQRTQGSRGTGARRNSNGGPPPPPLPRRSTTHSSRGPPLPPRGPQDPASPGGYPGGPNNGSGFVYR